MKSELLNDPAFEFTDTSRQWVDRVFSFLQLFFFFFWILSDNVFDYVDFWYLGFGGY